MRAETGGVAVPCVDQRALTWCGTGNVRLVEANVHGFEPVVAVPTKVLRQFASVARHRRGLASAQCGCYEWHNACPHCRWPIRTNTCFCQCIAGRGQWVGHAQPMSRLCGHEGPCLLGDNRPSRRQSVTNSHPSPSPNTRCAAEGFWACPCTV